VAELCALRARVLADLAREGIVDGHRLVAHYHAGARSTGVFAWRRIRRVPSVRLMAAIRREIDLRKLVNEFANNKVDSLELIREALSNAVDHGAKNVWIRSMRGEPPAQSVDLILVNDGEGMTAEQLTAFWGVSTSVKPLGQAVIGYKGHGSKLFFSARRLSVATRRDVADPWKLTSLEHPLESSKHEVEEVLLPADHSLARELAAVDLYGGVGVAIFVEGCQFRDADRFLARRPIESYIDWFTVIGDVRSGLFATRAEFHRRQLLTYLEGSRQPVGGEYDLDDRFGLWLCKDFIPIVKRNDLLVAALGRATERSKKRLRFDLSRTRFWQVFINNQDFLLTANRNDLANMREHDARIVEIVADRIAEELMEDAFREWIENLQQSIAAGRRSKEIDAMQVRVEAVTKWFQSTGGDIEPSQVELAQLDTDESLRLPRPTNEQELFYLYAVLSTRFVMPLRVIEYETRFGVDAIALVRDRKLFDPPIPYARVEFKYQLQGNRAIGHFFDAIDVIVCWTAASPGPLPEAGDTPQVGELRKRTKPRSASGLDSYEVEYTDAKGKSRIIPVLVLDRIFGKKRSR
jgi:hypothetical protein